MEYARTLGAIANPIAVDVNCGHTYNRFEAAGTPDTSSWPTIVRAAAKIRAGIAAVTSGKENWESLRCKRRRSSIEWMVLGPTIAARLIVRF